MNRKQWQNDIINDTVIHAYLFIGTARSRQDEEAAAFMQALICEKQTGQACQTCLACRKVLSGNHENVVRILPEGQSIKIDQIRVVQQQLFKEVKGRVVCLLEQAEKMTVQAANSLLKMLEEPPESVVFILVADQLEQIIPTIRSRCRIVNSPVPSDGHMLDRLIGEGFSSAIAKPAAAVAKDLGEARQFCQTEWFAQMKKVVIQCHEEVPKEVTKALLTMQDQLFQAKTERKEHIHVFIDLWILWCRDLLSLHYHRPGRIHFEGEQAQLETHMHAWPPPRLIRMVDLLLEAKLKLSRHVPQQLALEYTLLSLKGG